MKVALVHDWLTGMRGGEKCLEVACQHFPDAELFTLLHRRHSTSASIERMRITTSFLQRMPGIARCYRYLLPAMPTAIERLRIPDDIDLVLSFSSCVAKGILPPAGVPHVCYCFSPMRYAWHMKDHYFSPPEFGRGISRRAGRFAKWPVGIAREAVLSRVREWDRNSADRVTQFVAISQTIVRRIQDCYGRDSRVIHPPVDTDFYTPAAVSRSDYYLFVSALVPYKRPDLAIEACRRLGRRLVVIGTGPLKRRLAHRAAGNVEFLGWQPNRVIRDHLRRCRALLFPGLEDFGIVPVEAQACGCPVIALGQGGATETVLPSDEQTVGTGVLFGEQSVDALCRAMQWLEHHPGCVRPGLARAQAERFATQRFSNELLRLIHSSAHKHSDEPDEPQILPFPKVREAIRRRAA